MSWLFFKKVEKPAEVLAVEEFNKKLGELLSTDSYVSVKDYSFLVEQFSETNKAFTTINDAGLLSVYCKKNKIKFSFINSFLSSFKNLKNIISSHNKEFVESSMIKEKKYFDEILFDIDKNIVLDDDQRKAVLTDEDFCLVIAGAGAGKTTTVAAKVKYLVDKKNVNPEEILIISFTNKAVGELKNKINKTLNIPCPITTFHSAGNAILRKKNDEKSSIVEDSFLYNTIKDYLLTRIKDKNMSDKLVLFFGSYFDMQYEGVDKREFLNSIVKSDFSTLKGNLNEFSYTYVEKNTKRKVTLNNEIVQSSQEVQIANFLYLNGIEYEYEALYPYQIYMSKKRYSPDFLLKQNGKEIYLEHFGLSEDGKNDRYTEEEITKYKKAINDKIKIHQKHGTKLIYTYSKYNDGRSLTDHLTELLRESGIVSVPRSSEEVLSKLTLIQENKYISKMVYLICDFIKNFKTNGYTEDKFYEFIRIVKSERTKLFLEICKECYLEYQRTLSKNNVVDFQDMINDAARALREVAVLKEKLHFKYIIIDEYQDISRQRFDMAKELSKVTDAKIIAVGDDWQSIFAFSGSDVTLFTKFCEKMGYGEELRITRTYRNAQEVIDIAGGFIQKNDAQIKKSLISPKHIEDPIIIVSYDDTPKKWNERANEGGPLHKMAQALEYSIGEIVAKHGNKTSILLIGRYNYDGETLSRTGAFAYNPNGSKVYSKKYPQVDITFLTAHSSKGLGYDNVIIINAKDAVYGFPSKIEDDPVMKLVIKQSDEMNYAEERRLFYVALTRTKNRVFIIAPEKHPSEFVLELKAEYKHVVLKGKFSPEPHGLLTNKVCPICGYPLQRRYRKDCSMNLWVCTNEPEVCGFVSNNLAGGKMYIQKCTRCVDGYLIVKTKDGHPFLGCTNYTYDGKGCNNTISPQDFDESIKDKNSVEIKVVGSNQEERKESIVQMPKMLVESSFGIANEGIASVDIEGVYSNCESCLTELTANGVVELIISVCTEISEVNYFGATMIVNVLRGSKEKQVIKHKFNELGCYGVLKSIKAKHVFDIVEFLIEEKFLYRTRGLYPTVRVNTEKTIADIQNTDLSTVKEIMALNNTKANGQIQGDDDCQTITIEGWEVFVDKNGELLTDIKLLKRLQALRKQIGDEKNIPYYCVVWNSVLVQLATKKPTTKEEFVAIKGIGDKWFYNNGYAFMKEIKDYVKKEQGEK